MEDIFRYLLTNVTSKNFIPIMVWQGIFWSIADIVIVYCILKITNFLKENLGTPKIFMRYILLWFSIILTPGLLIVKPGMQYIFMEAVICGTQYGIIIYTLFEMRKEFLSLGRDIVDRALNLRTQV